MRTYTFLADRPGGYMNWPGQVVTTNMRIRQTAAVLFRRWFGRAPDRYLWHVDGWMAGAADRRGNCIEVTQENWPGRQLPAVSGICQCGRPPIVGLNVCYTCHKEAA